MGSLMALFFGVFLCGTFGKVENSVKRIELEEVTVLFRFVFRGRTRVDIAGSSGGI